MLSAAKHLRHVQQLSIVLVYCATASLALAAPAKKPEPRFETCPSHVMLAPGGSAEIRLRAVDAQDKPLAGELTVHFGSQAPARLQPDATGWATYRFQAPKGLPEGVLSLELRQPLTGVAGKYYVDLLDQAAYDAFQAAADRVQLAPLPAHLLFIGDSLSDLFRGQNYVDKVEFWLGRRFGDRVSVKNVGVGGDTITRVWDRLQAVPGTYRLEMYQSIFTPKPTHVFFFLGHNDSKLTSVSGYREHAVEPGQFDAQYRLALGKVKAETGARIVVLSATSSVWEITQATAEKRRAAGKPHTLFGKPEELQRYNALARRAAAECGAEWLDVYEPTRRNSQKAVLFTADGVHVSNQGNRLLALEILKHLAPAKSRRY
jgi:lysophospholipase L1-like esterase